MDNQNAQRFGGMDNPNAKNCELSAFEKSLLDGNSDDGESGDDFTEENFNGKDDDAPPRKRKRGKGSRNRQGRKNRSRTSRSSSSSSTSEDSDYSCDSQDASSRSNSEADDLHHRQMVKKEAREEGLRKSYEAASPLPRIPKRIEFAASTGVAPEIVSIEKKKLRARVRITEEILEHFESCAMGMYVGQEERVAHFEKLPLVASGLAAVPVLDEGLKVTQFRLGVDEHTMVAEEEAILNALNLLAIGRNEAREGRLEKTDMYSRQAMELLGIVIHDLNVRRRERFFRSFGVDPSKSVPNYRRLPIEMPTRSADKPWNEFAPALIGSRLSTEVVDKTQCQKLTAALVKEKKTFKGERSPSSKTRKPVKRSETRAMSSSQTKRTTHRTHQSKMAKDDERRNTDAKRVPRTQKKKQ